MAKNCAACDELRNDAPNLIVNGLTNTEIASLKNNTGFSPSNGNDDCTDLNNANDCLIGNMESEVDAYDVCDWRTFMKEFIGNVWTMFASIIAAICGLWTNIKNLWTAVNQLKSLTDRIDCIVDYMFKGASFAFGENMPGKDSKLVHGKGVDFSLRQGSESHSSDITILYIAGGLAQVGGSLRTFTESFKDADGVTQSGNTVWDFTGSDWELPKGGELLYEIRIKKSEYPQIKRIFNGHALAVGGANQSFETRIISFDGDSPSQGDTTYAYGQHGWCDYDGTPSETGYSSGHAVPKGWIYVQVRMYAVQYLPVGNVTDGAGATKRGSNFSPAGYMGMRMNQDGIEC